MTATDDEKREAEIRALLVDIHPEMATDENWWVFLLRLLDAARAKIEVYKQEVADLGKACDQEETSLDRARAENKRLREVLESIALLLQDEGNGAHLKPHVVKAAFDQAEAVLLYPRPRLPGWRRRCGR